MQGRVRLIDLEFRESLASNLSSYRAPLRRRRFLSDNLAASSRTEKPPRLLLFLIVLTCVADFEKSSFRQSDFQKAQASTIGHSPCAQSLLWSVKFPTHVRRKISR